MQLKKNLGFKYKICLTESYKTKRIKKYLFWDFELHAKNCKA